MKKHILWVIGVAFTFTTGYSQPWLAKEANLKMVHNNPDFKQQQQLFEAYWKDKKVEKGKGYKPFRRWEYLMEPRLSSDGSIQNIELWNALTQLQNQHNGTSGSYDWKSDGPTTTPLVAGLTEISGNGRVNCIQFHPADTNIIFIGAPSGGLWKSTDGGKNWTTTTDMLAAIGISDIAIHPTYPDTMYIATGDGDAGDTYGIGILRSSDAGATWEPTNLALEITNLTYFRRLLINPDNPQVMIATSSSGIYYTDNAWQTYTKELIGNYKDLEFKPDDYSVVYATRYDYSGKGSVYVSFNGGKTFTKRMDGFTTNNTVNRIELAVTPNNPDIVYALASKSDDNGLFGLFVSTDSAQTWAKVYGNDKNLLGWEENGSDAGGQGWYDLSLAVSPDNYNEVFVGGVNVWKSTNGGKNWTLTGHWTYNANADYIHADHHMFAFSPYTGNLYSGNDGGVYVTYNKAKSWKSISNGLSITQIYKLSTSQNEAKKVLFGSQDNGTFLLANQEWLNVLGGDGMECIIDYSDDNILYGSVYYGSIYRSMDGGESFSPVVPSGNPNGAWVTPYVIHPQNPNILFAGYTDVYMTSNRGNSWEPISDNLTNGNTIKVLEISKSNPNYLYAAYGSYLFKTDDLGKNWTSISSALPRISITSIAIADKDPQKIWVTLSGYTNGSKVFQSFDGGATWTNISEGLPNLPANTICHRNNSFHELYVGTDVGVYYRNASMDSWEFISMGLPNVIINELEINYATDELYAATYGRGVWHTPLLEVVPHPAAFVANNSTICYDGDFMLYYTSPAPFDSLRWEVEDANIKDHSVNFDTLWVSFLTTGKKDVSLTHYYNGVSTTNPKTHYVSVENEIDFTISPNQVFSCSNEPVTISATNNYDYSWSPAELLDTTQGSIVVLTPKNGAKVTVTGQNGSCSQTKTIDVQLVPDDIHNAIYLSLGGHGPFNNSCAGMQQGEPVPPAGSFGDGCNTQDGWCKGEARIDNSIWFKLTVPPSGSLSIATLGFDNQIALYEAVSSTEILKGNYTMLAANDDHASHDDYSAVLDLITGLTPGDTLWLQVDGSFGGAVGSFHITIDSLVDRTTTPITRASQFHINVYPNPSNGLLSFDYKIEHESTLTVDVFNASGNKIESRVFSENTSFHNQLDLTGNKGIFILRFTTRDKQVYRKVIIE